MISVQDLEEILDLEEEGLVHLKETEVGIEEGDKDPREIRDKSVMAIRLEEKMSVQPKGIVALLKGDMTTLTIRESQPIDIGGEDQTLDQNQVEIPHVPLELDLGP